MKKLSDIIRETGPKVCIDSEGEVLTITHLRHEEFLMSWHDEESISTWFTDQVNNVCTLYTPPKTFSGTVYLQKNGLFTVVDAADPIPICPADMEGKLTLKDIPIEEIE